MAWNLPRDPEESADKDTPEAESLLDAMHSYAEEWSAGWLNDMEFILWSAVQMDRRWAAAEWHEAASRARVLRALAHLSGGWWIWGGPEGRTFLSLDVWERRYAARSPSAHP